MPWLNLIDVAEGAGYDAVDISLWDASERTSGEICDRLAAAGIEAGGVPLPVEFRADNKTFERDLEQFPRLAAFAAQLGITAMCRALPPSSDTPKGEYTMVIRRRIVQCAQILEPYDIRLGVEFIGPLHMRNARAHQFIWKMDETLEFAESCGYNVGLLLDAWHWHHVAADKNAIIEAGPMLVHVQISDAPDLKPAEIRDNERLLPGDGVIDFTAFFAALATAGYDGFISPEVFGYTRRQTESETECARRALLSVHKVMNARSDSTSPDVRSMS